jgi:desulfoferrodoxin (superoxide reductase-like protein)
METKKIAILLSMIFMVTALLAHPPGKPEISYDKNTGDLIIEFSHPVKDAAKHFIDKIWVYVNGDEVEVITYEEQTNLEGHKVVLNMPNLESGTKIKVKANCNIFGKKKGKYKIK